MATKSLNRTRGGGAQSSETTDGAGKRTKRPITWMGAAKAKARVRNDIKTTEALRRIASQQRQRSHLATPHASLSTAKQRVLSERRSLTDAPIFLETMPRRLPPAPPQPAPPPATPAEDMSLGEGAWPAETPAELDALNQALAAATARGDASRRDLLNRPDMLTLAEVAKRLGMSRDTTNRRRQDGLLLAVQGEARGFRYPEWHIVDGQILKGIDTVIARTGNGWAAFFALQRIYPSAGQSGRELLLDRREEVLLDLIAGFGEAFS